MFKSMKIEVKDELHLKTICDILESISYKRIRWGTFDPLSLRTWDDGGYTNMRSKQKYDYGYEKVTLTDLLKMRDDTVKGKSNELCV